MENDIEKLSGVVLSVQSHVVKGYVGNKVASFVLQTNGFEVQQINTVQFSNHTKYPDGFTGKVLNDEDLDTLIKGLEKNKVLGEVNTILTGYIGSKNFIQKLFEIIKKIKENNKDVVYICDPVIGDMFNGAMKFVVPKELIEEYRENMLTLADLITPNQYEAEILSGIKIESESDTLKSIDWFHTNKKIRYVVVTSVLYPNTTKRLTLYASKRIGNDKELYKIDFDKFEGDFTGCGDCIASLLTANVVKHKDNFKQAIENALNSCHYVLKNTPKGGELKLVQCRKFLENPKIVFKAEKIEN